MATILTLSVIGVMLLPLMWHIETAPEGYEDECGFHLRKRPVSRLRRHHGFRQNRAKRLRRKSNVIVPRHTARANIISRIHGHRGVSPFFELRPPLWSLHSRGIPGRFGVQEGGQLGKNRL